MTTDQKALLASAAGMGICLGALMPAAGVALLVVVPIAAVTVALTVLWSRKGWPVWWLALGAGASALGVTWTSAYDWYGAAAQGLLSAEPLTAVPPWQWASWGLMAAPLAITVGAVLAIPLLVRRQAVAEVLESLRPRWSRDDEDDHQQVSKLRSVS